MRSQEHKAVSHTSVQQQAYSLRGLLIVNLRCSCKRRSWIELQLLGCRLSRASGSVHDPCKELHSNPAPAAVRRAQLSALLLPGPPAASIAVISAAVGRTKRISMKALLRMRRTSRM